MDIRTEYNPKPIPWRNFDWEAYDHDNMSEESFVGFGATKEEAIAELVDFEDSRV